MKRQMKMRPEEEWTAFRKASLVATIIMLIAVAIAIFSIVGCTVGNLQVEVNIYLKEYQEMLYPTVRITADTSTGSGVILRNDQYPNSNDQIYVLTAAHVVGNNTEVNIEFFTDNNISTIAATVVATDTIKDLALLRAYLPDAFRIYAACLAPKDYQPSLFTPVFAVGCSLGLSPRPSSGIIAAIGTEERMNGETEEQINWEISAPILPGNSGGPVFQLRANSYELIGIAVSVCVYNGQLISTMAQVVPIQEIYEFLKAPRLETAFLTGQANNPDRTQINRSPGAPDEYPCFSSVWIGGPVFARNRECVTRNDISSVPKLTTKFRNED